MTTDMEVTATAAKLDHVKGKKITFTSNDTDSDIPMDQDQISRFQDSTSRLTMTSGTPALNEWPIGSPERFDTAD